MRNLHHIKIYYNTPFFLDILASFNIIVDPEIDKNILRRFIIGHNMTTMKQPIRSQVKRTIMVPAEFNYSTKIDLFFSYPKENLLKFIKENGIEEESVTEIDVLELDDEMFFEVTYTSLETDQELAIRQRRVDIFNSMLAHQKEIDDKCYSLQNK